MMIYTFSRDAVEAGVDVGEPYAVVSISTPRLTPATLPRDSLRRDLLRLVLHDSTPGQGMICLYTVEDARRVAALVRVSLGVSLVVHCDMGISRSQGMANAIADHLDTEVRHSTPGMPNPHVYRLTWEALRRAPSWVRAPRCS